MRDKSAKFVELANKRVNRALDAIRLVGNLSNTANYEYTNAQVKKITAALQQELDQVKAAFKAKGSGEVSNFRL